MYSEILISGTCNQENFPLQCYFFVLEKKLFLSIHTQEQMNQGFNEEL